MKCLKPPLPTESELELKIGLAPLDSTDMALIRSWRNDYQIWKWCRQNDLISDAEQTRWFESQSKDPTIKMYKIMMASDKDSGPIGVCGFTSIDLYNRRAEFSLYVAPRAQKNGFGRVALSLLLDHGFKNLGLNLIWGESFDQNPATQLFDKLGFVKEGTRRQFYFRDGKLIDAHLYSLTSEEWNARHNLNSKPVSVDSDPDAAESKAARPPKGLKAISKEV